MNDEQVDLILELSGNVRQLATVVRVLSERVEALEAQVDQLRPRNEYGLTAQDAEFFQQLTHVMKHPDCPLAKDETCPWFNREFVSFNVMDWIPAQKDILRRLDAIEYSLPSDIRRDVNAAMGKESSFEGVAE